MARPLVAAVLGILSLPAFARSETETGPIQDNSFLIEEAYNQEPGVIQHINTFVRSRSGAWGYSFTEEWPVFGQTHQASITFTAARPELGSAGPGDLALNYRVQAIGRGDTRLALAPRLTVLAPTGDSARGLGYGGAGVQVNVPLSVTLAGGLVTHVNVGGTYVPSARDLHGSKGASRTFAAGQSLAWLAHRNVNLLIEALYTRTELALATAAQRSETLTINPGVRGAINLASGLQIVPGLAVPMGIARSRGERAVFFYLSFEHPLRVSGAKDGRS